LGWNPGDEREIFSMEELIEAFDMDRISKSSAAFSMDKLRWINGEHIRALSPDAFHEVALPWYGDALRDFDLQQISQLIQIRTDCLGDIPEMLAFLAELPEYDIALFENQKSKSSLESSKAILEAVIPVLEKQEDFSNAALFETLKLYAKESGNKVGTTMWPIRTALSGAPASPGGATELASLLGKEETLRRLRLGLEKLLA